MNKKHNILVAYDDVSVHRTPDAYRVSVGEQSLTLTQEQTESLFRAFDGLFAAMED